MLILYDGTTSVCAIKVRLALAEKGLEFESRNIDLRKGEQFAVDYLKLNPNAVVPTLVDNGEVILESSIIIQYLEDLTNENPLLPKTPLNRAKMRFWLKRVDNPIHPSAGILTHATAFRPSFLEKTPEEQKEHLAKIPDKARRARQEAVYRDGLRAEIVVTAIRTFDNFIRDLEFDLKTHDFIAGPDYSLADVAVTPYINRLEALKLLDVWRNVAPRVINWFEQIRQRPSFQSAIVAYLTDSDILQFKNIDDSCAARARELLKER
jgi:glutathione S-transferase